MEYFDKKCDPIDTDKWVKLFSDKSYQIIKQTQLHTGAHISTVWLGLTHGYGPNGPLIFETLITLRDEEEEMYRYATEEEAIKHHNVLADITIHNEVPPNRWQSISDEIE
jgi:hypothetical protein